MSSSRVTVLLVNGRSADFVSGGSKEKEKRKLKGERVTVRPTSKRFRPKA